MLRKLGQKEGQSSVPHQTSVTLRREELGRPYNPIAAVQAAIDQANRQRKLVNAMATYGSGGITNDDRR